MKMYFKNCRTDSGSLNLELSLIIGLVVLAVTGSLVMVAASINGVFDKGLERIEGRDPITIPSGDTGGGEEEPPVLVGEGEIDIVVKDDQGVVVPGVPVTITKTGELGAHFVESAWAVVKFTSVTANDGIALFRDIPEGQYNMVLEETELTGAVSVETPVQVIKNRSQSYTAVESVVPLKPRMVFFDDFNRDDASTAGNNWVNGFSSAYPAADRGIKSNMLYANSGTTTRVMGSFRYPAGLGNNRAIEFTFVGGNLYRIEAYVGSTDRGTSTSPSVGNNYRLQINASNVRFYRNTSTISSLIPFVAEPGDVLRFERRGDRLTFLANGVVVANVVDGTFMVGDDSTEYHVGVIVTGTSALPIVYLDDFKVFELP